MSIGHTPSLGQTPNAGGARHTQFLEATKAELEARGCTVKLFYQPEGTALPDGLVERPDGSTAHLEAEASTLTKPAKVLTNLTRAVRADRDVIVAVTVGDHEALERIIEDPVNRRGIDERDSQGPFSYYRGADGEPFVDLEILADVDVEVLPLALDDEAKPDEPEPACPELAYTNPADLAVDCLYRTGDRECLALGRHCVLEAP